MNGSNSHFNASIEKASAILITYQNGRTSVYEISDKQGTVISVGKLHLDFAGADFDHGTRKYKIKNGSDILYVQLIEYVVL